MSSWSFIHFNRYLKLHFSVFYDFSELLKILSLEFFELHYTVEFITYAEWLDFDHKSFKFFLIYRVAQNKHHIGTFQNSSNKDDQFSNIFSVNTVVL